MNQKGFNPILPVIGIFIVLGLLGGAYYLGVQKTNKIVEDTNQVDFPPASKPISGIDNPSSTPTEKKDYIPLKNIWNSARKVYKNQNLDFSFEYPDYFRVEEVLIEKSNSDLARAYPDMTTDRAFLATFSTPWTHELNLDESNSNFVSEVCTNTMRFSVIKYLNKDNLILYDFIKRVNTRYAGNGIVETFDTYKKNLKETDFPKVGSYVFTGIVGENPKKHIYFVNNSNVYLFTLGGGCDTGAGYSQEAETVLNTLLENIKFD